MSLTVYKSSAGSGKTYTLVLEYLCLVIANPDSYRNILAITFTNKAASEMKSRIVQALENISFPKDETQKKDANTLVAKIAEKTGMDVPAIISRAEKSLSNILHGYSNFAVSTIDSFVHGLVRSFAQELRLPVNFDVELDVDKLIEKIIDLLMAKVGNDEQITHLLVRFITTKMEDEKSWNIEQELHAFAKILLKENSINAVAKLRNVSLSDFLAISKKLAETIHSLKTRMIQPSHTALSILDDHAIEAQYLYYGTKGAFGYFDKISKGDFSKHEPNNYVKKLLAGEKWTSGKCPGYMEAVIEQNKPQLMELLQEQVGVMEQNINTFFLLELILQNIYSTALLNEFETVMEEFRAHENIVHISEFNKRIAEVLHNNPIPYIYERIGEKFHHLLIDEFQDTSVLQWQNLLPLIENSLAANHFNMIVGDGKQAIYRWRSGEVEQFATLPEIYNRPNDAFWQQRQQLFKSNYQEENLDKNFRSTKEIVAFNNDFFDFAANHLSENLKKIYEGQRQTFREDKTGGLVQIEFIEKAGFSSDEILELELDRILQLVLAQKESEFKLNEIAILTRTNDQASLVARYLLENNIKVVTVEALQLSASSDVNFVIDVLRYINDSSAKPTIAGMVVFLLEKQKAENRQLHDLLEIVEEINPKHPEAKSIEWLICNEFKYPFKIDELRTLPIYEMADRIVKIFQLNDGGQNPFITFFRDLILKFTARNTENLNEFLKYWDDSGNKQNIVMPEKAEAVRVMTIHKAKGLQFPVVIYPFAKHQSKIAIEEVWIEPELESFPQLKAALVKNVKKISETAFAQVHEKEIQKSFLDGLNVLYVAMTRPSERLFVILHDKLNEKGEWKTAHPFPDNADLLYGYLQSTGVWDNGQKIYSFGSAGLRKVKISDNTNQIVKEQEKNESEDSCKVDSAYTMVFDFRDNISLRFSAPETRESENTIKYRRDGIMMHDLMATIRTAGDVSAALHKAIVDGLLEESDFLKYQKYILHVISHPEAAFLFDTKKKVFNEKEILLKNGKTLRPDRIVIEDEMVWLADYKTGLPDPKHRRQLNHYAEALNDTGLNVVSKCLIYLDVENLQSVTFERWS